MEPFEAAHPETVSHQNTCSTEGKLWGNRNGFHIRQVLRASSGWFETNINHHPTHTRVWRSMVAMVILPSGYVHDLCVPHAAQCAITESCNHSFFIYYGHGTLDNCVIHTNPSANALKWSTAWLANKGIKVTWSLKLYGQWKDERGQEAGKKCGVGGNLTVMGSRPPSPLSQRRKPTELWREEERIYSWLLFWGPCQTKPLRWVCVLFSQQSATVTQHWLQLKQGQEETNKGNEIWIWKARKAVHDSALSPPELPSLSSG